MTWIVWEKRGKDELWTRESMTGRRKNESENWPLETTINYDDERAAKIETIVKEEGIEKSRKKEKGRGGGEWFSFIVVFSSLRSKKIFCSKNENTDWKSFCVFGIDWSQQ